MFGFRRKKIFYIDLDMDGEPYDQFSFFDGHVVGELASIIDVIGIYNPSQIQLDIQCKRTNRTIQRIVITANNSVDFVHLDQFFTGSYGNKEEARNFVFAYLGTFLGSHFPDRGTVFKL